MTRPIQLDTTYVNRSVELPYGLQVSEVEKGVAETYRLFNGINDFLIQGGFDPSKNSYSATHFQVFFPSSWSKILLVRHKRWRPT
jgi:hypothetical protein